MDGVITGWNTRAAATFGWPAAEAIGRSIAATIIPERYRERHRAGLEHFRASGEGSILGRRIEITALHRDGHEFAVELTVTPVRIVDRVMLCAFIRDISARGEAEARLRTSQRLLERAQALAHLGSWQWDVGSDTVTWSDELYRIYGLAPESFSPTLEGYLQRVHPDERETVRAQIHLAVADQRPFRFTERILRPDGSERILLSEGEVILADDGRVGGLFGICQDVTDRRRTERIEDATLRIAEAAGSAPDLHALLEAVHAIVGELMDARNFYIALLDEGSGRLTFPYFVDEVDTVPAPKTLGRGLTEFVLPSIDWLGVPLIVGDRTIGALVTQTYAEGAHLGERERNILQFVSTQVAAAIQRKRGEEQLKESESKYRQIFENSPEAMWVYDRETLGFLAVNEATVRRYGYTREEFLRMTIRDMYPASEHARLAEVLADERPGPRTVHDLIHRRKDGTLMNAETSSDVVVMGGRAARLVHARDMTERTRLETQLRQAQRMEAVGQLAGGVAHDFNNLLTAIIGYADLLLEDMPVGEHRRHDVEEIRTASQSAADLTQQLLAFSRKQVLQPRVLDLNDVVKRAEKLLRRLIGENIELSTTLAADLGTVRADPAQLEQVIVNLAVNARDAMPGGGSLIIETANRDLTAADASPELPVPAGRYVQLCVTDTGSGMDDATRARLFEPFFTTKEMGKGTGLGLATVYGIVKQSDAFIGVDSKVGDGTTFRVLLPRVAEPAQPLRLSTPVPMPRGRETILLVEDERAIRLVVRRTLERQGYAVLDAPDGTGALDVAAGHDGAIDLMISDVVMPGMGGDALARELARSRPDTRVLFISGYSEDAIEQRGVLKPGVAYLAKPFGPDQLARKVREVLDGPRQA